MTQTHARRTDPVTSHEAAEFNEPRRPAQVVIVAEKVKRYPGHTSAELAALSQLGRYVFGRRLSDAAALGLVYMSDEKRKCRLSRRNAMTWHPTAKWLTVGCE